MKMSISIYELFHYSLFPGLFVPPIFFLILLSFLGFSFRHIPNNLSNYNVLTANAPFFYQISGTWSNHEGSIFSWYLILSFYGFLLCYRKCHNLSNREFYSVMKKKSAPTKKMYIPFVPNRKALVDFRSREGKMTHTLLYLAREERAESIDVKSIALFFSPFLSASSDPFVRNFFVRTEPLAESNPVPQDPILAIHPPCIYAGNVASAMGFCLCRSKMMTLNHKATLQDAAEKTGTLLVGCLGSRLFFFTLKFKHVGSYPALLLRSKIKTFTNKLSFLRKKSLSSFWTGALVDMGREQAKRVVRNRKKETTTSPLFPLLFEIIGSSSENLIDQVFFRILILTCRWFLTVGILLGSWWAYHELGWGGWWFRDPVENASFMPRVLATARIHSVIIPLLHSWTFFLNIVTFPCCVSGTFSIRSGLLAPVHSFAIDDTRGRFFWRFFLLLTGISILLFSQMNHRTYKKEMAVAQLVHLRHSAHS